MMKVVPIAPILVIGLLSGCASKIPPQAVITAEPSHLRVQFGSYPKKEDIPPSDIHPQDQLGYSLTKADINYLRWVIQFDSKVRRLRTKSLSPSKLHQEQIKSFAQKWRQIQIEFNKRESPTASKGVWAGYDLYLRENESRYAELLPSHPDTPEQYTDEEWERFMQSSTSSVNYCLDLIDRTFPGKLPADIVSYRVK